MTREGSDRGWLLGAAAALAVSALATGPLASFLASPGVIALAILGVRTGGARSPASGPGVVPGRAVIGVGAFALVAGLALAIAGPGWPGLVTAALAAGACRAGLARALAEEPVGFGGGEPAPPLAVAVDELARLGTGLALRASRGTPAESLAESLRAEAERQRDAGWREDPGAAHARPPGLEKPRVERASFGVGGLAVEHLCAESEFEPFDPQIRESWLARAANRTAHAWLLRRSGPPRPALVCVAPQRIGHPKLLARLFSASRLDSIGLDLALVPLPLQGPRAEGPLGARLFGAEPSLTNAAVAQAVWDLRRLVGWLRAEGAPAVGILGLGGGGSVVALLASIDPRLVCAVLAAPIVSPAAHLARVVPEPVRLAWTAAGIDDALLEDVLVPSSPLRHTPHLPLAGRLLVAATADRWVPPVEMRALHAHWEGPPLYWLPGSHFWPRRRDAESRVVTHLRDTLAAPDASALPLTRFR